MAVKRALTREQIRAAGKPAGYRLLADFLADIKRGDVPSTPRVEQLAAAFREILAGKDAQHALGLVRRPGQRGKAAGRLAKADFIAARIEADRGPRRGALARALDAAQIHFGTRRKPYNRRELEKIWQEWGPVAVGPRATARAVSELPALIDSCARGVRALSYLSRKLPGKK